MQASIDVLRVLISMCLSLCWCFSFRLPWDSATNWGDKGERLLIFFLVSFEVFSQYRLCANDTQFCLSPSAKWPRPTVSSLMFTSNLSSLCFSLETILKLIKFTVLQRANCAVVSIGECPLISSLLLHARVLTYPCRFIFSNFIAIAVNDETQNSVNRWLYAFGAQLTHS